MNLPMLALFVFPLLSIVLGVLGYLIFRKMYMMPSLIFLISFIATYTIFNASFWIWVVVYTFLSFISGYLVKFFISKNKK